MPHYTTDEFSDPNFIQFESYHLTWYDDGYGKYGPYGEPIPLHLEEYFLEPYSPKSLDKQVDFPGRFWNEIGLTDQAYNELMLPFHDGDSLGGDSGSYFNGHWKDGMFTYAHGVSSNGNGDYGYSMEKVEDSYEGGDYDYSMEKVEDSYEGEEKRDGYYSYDDDNKKQPAYYYDCWFGYGVDEDWPDYDIREYEGESSSSHNAYEMRLCDRIFGPWSYLSRTNHESYVQDGLS